MENTLVVNLYAGPGSGKSTGAMYVTSVLKMKGYDVEYVSEFAKDKVWEDNKEVFNCQPYITGKQLFKLSRCNGKVKIIVTDSPLLIGLAYKDDNPHYKDFLLFEYDKFNNVNYFIDRVKEFNPNGRLQTEYEAKRLDDKIKYILNSMKLIYISVSGDKKGYDQIVEDIIETLN